MSETTDAEVRFFIWLTAMLGLIALYLYVLLGTLPIAGNPYGTEGFAYYNGIIRIDTNHIDSYEAYKGLSDHEWGHIAYRRLNATEKRAFDKLAMSEPCTTTYTCQIAKSYGKGNLYVEEECAERFRLSKEAG